MAGFPEVQMSQTRQGKGRGMAMSFSIPEGGGGIGWNSLEKNISRYGATPFLAWRVPKGFVPRYARVTDYGADRQVRPTGF